MNITNKYVLPFDISLNFELLLQHYQERLSRETNKIVKSHLKNIISCFEENPKLTTGITTLEELNLLHEPIHFLLNDLFPQALSLNEIKAATIPFQSQYFYQSQRFKNILSHAGEDFEFSLVNFSKDEMYVMTCNYILALKYGIKRNYQKPFYYTIPNKSGDSKTYRLTMNADFLKMEPTTKFKEISPDIIDELLGNFDDIDLWKKHFPPNSWKLDGFVIMTLSDVTFDTIVSDMKSNMLNHSISNDTFTALQENFKRFFKIPDLAIGFSKYNSNSDSFIAPKGKTISSFILGNNYELNSKKGLCEISYEKIIKQKKYLAVSNIEKTLKSSDNAILKKIYSQGFNSCIIAPIIVDDRLIGTLELLSPHKNDLNSVIASRLDVIMPYLKVTSERSLQESKNYIRAIIQKECTAIHPTIFWKFEKEAAKYMEATFIDNKGKEQFNDIIFDHVVPLYGQIDIIGSSTVRNKSIQTDFIKQLKMVKSIFEIAYDEEKLAFYDQLIYRINTFITDFKSDFNTTSEEQLLSFLKTEVNPIMPHVETLSDQLSETVAQYNNSIDKELGIVYDKRKEYENSVQLINAKVSSLLDKRQNEAQQIFPHFFERFKTDGVEHNIYIGQSLVENKPYSKVYLNNLRLWQLKTMCELEQEFYAVQQNITFKLSCASLVLVYGNDLSIRFRVDEKKLDVDGAYNARYEIVKKRIDKANIKGTSERITQKGKLVVVYSQKKDELEYLRYINYLQSKGYLKDNVEKLVLEDLQGVVGLKAIRADFNYNNQKQEVRFKDFERQTEK
jgi:hypothetical protein